MKHLFITIALLILGYCAYSQESYFIEGEDYYGYVFSREDSIGGFPPEIIIGDVPIGSRRYTLTEENIVQAEKILRENINTGYVKEYIKSWESDWKTRCRLNKTTLKNYYRQYIGYLTPDREAIVYITLITKGTVRDIKHLSDGLIEVHDGGDSYWTICINLQTQQVFNMNLNGMS